LLVTAANRRRSYRSTARQHLLRAPKIRDPRAIQFSQPIYPKFVTSAGETASAQAPDSLELAHRSPARTLHTDNLGTDTARASFAVGIVRDKKGSVDSGLCNSNTAPISSCGSFRRDCNFYRLAYRIGERLFALAQSCYFTKQSNDCH
jgi:hypothetical protein